MRYWLDTEFIEDGKTIDLISIGIVDEVGREYYAINQECDFRKANDWVVENVLKPMGLDRRGFYANLSDPSVSANYKDSLNQAKTRSEIAFELTRFIKQISDEEIPFAYTSKVYKLLCNAPVKSKPEIWGYYADYDWVVFCQLFGKMIDLPKGFPMYCRDIKQFCDDLGNPKLPTQTGEHHALYDAKWNKQAWEFLDKYSEDCIVERQQNSENTEQENNMPSTRAKFVCDQITKQARWEGAQIKLIPVTGGSEENKNFWQYTPNGEISLTISNPKAIAVFELGKEYYVDFTPAD